MNVCGLHLRLKHPPTGGLRKLYVARETRKSFSKHLLRLLPNKDILSEGGKTN